MVHLTLISFKIFITSVSIWENGKGSHMFKLIPVLDLSLLCVVLALQPRAFWSSKFILEVKGLS